MGHQPIDIESLTKWWGLWRWDKIKVRVTSDRRAFLNYERDVVNGSGHTREVHVGFFEKRRGVTIQDKAKRELAKLIDELKIRNEVILRRRQMEKEIQESVLK